MKHLKAKLFPLFLITGTFFLMGTTATTFNSAQDPRLKNAGGNAREFVVNRNNNTTPPVGFCCVQLEKTCFPLRPSQQRVLGSCIKSKNFYKDLERCNQACQKHMTNPSEGGVSGGD